MKTNRIPVTDSKIDTDLYSRQLLVYGSSAQLRLTGSHIVVIGEGPLKSEVVKNLALAGVGEITIQQNSITSSTTSPLINGGDSVGDYARNINSLVQVR
jgi:molybdopterin/thiamine biosynthesis adenylyltransferase